jgi:hypothetical protein
MTRDAFECSDAMCDASPLFVALLDDFGCLVRGLNGQPSLWTREPSSSLCSRFGEITR